MPSNDKLAFRCGEIAVSHIDCGALFAFLGAKVLRFPHLGNTTLQGVKNIPYIWYKAAKRMVCMMDKDVCPIYNKV